VGSFVSVGIPEIRRHGAVTWSYGLYCLCLRVRDSWCCGNGSNRIRPQRDGNIPESTMSLTPEHAESDQRAPHHWQVRKYGRSRAVLMSGGNTLLHKRS